MTHALSLSLKVLQEVSEWAAWLVCLFEDEVAFVRGGVGLPLGVNLEVFLHALMADVHVLVAPERRGHLRLSDDLSDVRLGAAELRRLVHGVDVIENGALGDGREVIQEVGVAISDCGRETVLTAWNKSEFPWEVHIRLLCTVLRVRGHL